MIRILIVDDSILFRNQIHLALKDCPDFSVVGAVSNGSNALIFMNSNEVDLCVLDLEMPVMDGLTTLKVMADKAMRVKVIMFSAVSKAAAEKTLEAMRLGAVDFVTKPSADGSALTPAQKIGDVLVPKIRSLFLKSCETQDTRPRESSFSSFKPRALAIASSTGGPGALQEFFSELKGVYIPVPILLVQHMPPVFTTSLAEQLGRIAGKKSKEGAVGDVLMPDQIYVAPGDFHMTVKEDALGARIELNQGPQINFVRPAADLLFETVGSDVLAVVLTGMGRDGADGARFIKKRGGRVLIQDEASCVVFGMPGAVRQEGLHDYMGRPSELARKCVTIFSNMRVNDVA